jgi:hypothetical protein
VPSGRTIVTATPRNRDMEHHLYSTRSKAYTKTPPGPDSFVMVK